MTNYQVYLRTCRELVIEAESTARIDLNDAVNAYLIALLAKNFDRPDSITYSYDLTTTVCADADGYQHKTQFVESAERCLMISGVTPFVAERRGLAPKHFTQYGRSFYQRAAHCTRPPDEFMTELAQQFDTMRDVVGTAFDKSTKTFAQNHSLAQAGSKVAKLFSINIR